MCNVCRESCILFKWRTYNIFMGECCWPSKTCPFKGLNKKKWNEEWVSVDREHDQTSINKNTNKYFIASDIILAALDFSGEKNKSI